MCGRAGMRVHRVEGEFFERHFILDSLGLDDGNVERTDLVRDRAVHLLANRALVDRETKKLGAFGAGQSRSRRRA